MKKELILIGKILKTHGIKGNLSAIFYSEKVFSEYKNFFDNGGRKLDLKIVSKPLQNSSINSINETFKSIVNLNSTDNCNDAMRFVHQDIYIDKADVGAREDEFLVSDLIGMGVFKASSRDENIGVVKDVHDFGGGVIIEIDFKNGCEVGNFKMFPFDDETFPEIDCENKKIYFSFNPTAILNADDDNSDLTDDELAVLSKKFEEYIGGESVPA